VDPSDPTIKVNVKTGLPTLKLTLLTLNFRVSFCLHLL